MSEFPEIMHDNTDNIVCPNCGDESEDETIFNISSFDLNCGNCGVDFHVERETQLQYFTSKIEVSDNES